MAFGTGLRKEREWRERMARFRRAGISVVQFCTDEGVSTPAFYAWRKRLSAEAADVAGRRHGPFASVQLTGAVRSGSQVTVSLRGGTRLEIPLSDPAVAATLIEAILQADAERAGGRPC